MENDAAIINTSIYNGC